MGVFFLALFEVSAFALRRAVFSRAPGFWERIIAMAARSFLVDLISAARFFDCSEEFVTDILVLLFGNAGGAGGSSVREST